MASTAPSFGLGDALGLAAERRSGGLDGIEGVGLAAAATLRSVRPVDLDDGDARTGQELGQPRTIGTLNRPESDGDSVSLIQS
jgi:hypothetical protein